jgi:hypothetical protein
MAAQVIHFQPQTQAHISEVRAICNAARKRWGLSERFWVRKGKGSIRGSIQVQAVTTTAEQRIELCEALLAAGFEHVHACYGHSLTDHFIRLAREWNHSEVKLMIAKKV